MTHRRLLDIVKQAGDDNLGQTLIRLAEMAAAQHQIVEQARHTLPAAGSAVGAAEGRPFRTEVKR